MGVFYTTDMKLFLSLALTTLTAHHAASDWVGTGQVQCYGHVNVDVSTPPGGDYLDRGQVTCRPAEWVFESQLGPEAMFFKPQTGAEFEIWAWDYHEPNTPWAECDGDIWYKQDDMGAGYCVPNKGYNGCGYASLSGLSLVSLSGLSLWSLSLVSLSLSLSLSHLSP